MKRLVPLVMVGVLFFTLPQAAALADASSDLIAAAARGQADRVNTLLKGGADVNARDSAGYTPTIWAALNGHDKVLAELLRNRANLGLRDKEGYTALMWAAQNHHIDAVRALLRNGARPDDADHEGYTALTWAAQDGEPGIAGELLASGADPNQRDRLGYTALMWAAQQGHNSVVKLLLANGANSALRDVKGFTALDLAIAFNRDDVKTTLTRIAAMMPTSQSASSRVIKASAHRKARGKLVAVVSTPDLQKPTGPEQGQEDAKASPLPLKATVGGRGRVVTPDWNSVEAKVLSFDADGNHLVDGRDWIALKPERRLELAGLLHSVRVRKNDRSIKSVMTKLDWVYADTARRGLTLNMAFDFPTPDGTGIIW